MSEEVQGSPDQTVNFSGSINDLVAALAKATLEFKPVLKGNKNPFFKSKYADLATLIEATREPLAKNGLVIVQFPGEASNGTVAIITALLHSSGQWLRSETGMPCGKPDAQGVGSALTYGRRYAYGAMLNLGAEDDDDAEGSIDRKNNEVREELNEKMKKQERISQLQVAQVWAAMKRNGKTAEELTAKLAAKKLVQLEDVTQELFPGVINWANGGVKPIREAAPLIEQKDLARVFATATERGIPQDDVKKYAHETHKVESMKNLTKPQLQEVLDWVSGA